MGIMVRKQTAADQALRLDNQICFAVYSTAHAFNRVYKPLLDRLGLTYPQYLVMLALWGDAPLRFREVSEMLRMDAATLSPIVKRLEQAGYVSRTPVEGDERTFSLAPTEAGRALRERALDVPPAVVDRLGVPVERLMALRDELTAVIAAVDQGV